MFIINFPFINPFGLDTLNFEVSYYLVDNATGVFKIPQYESYSNLWIHSFLAFIGVYGSTLFAFEEFKFRREEAERR